ncbi:MAG: ATP-binding protein [Bacteroidia bacterium]|nr:ATP-binding protein [Bacteroidia bacterium]
MKALSLRTRIVGIFVIFYGTLFVMLLMWMMFHLREDFLKEVDEGIDAAAADLSLTLERGGSGVDSLGRALEQTSARIALARHVSIEHEGGTLYSCTDFPPEARAVRKGEYVTVFSDPLWHRVHVRQVGIYTLTIAEGITAMEHTLEESFLLIIISIPIVVFLSVIGGNYVVRRLLHPIDQIITKARRITSENLGERLPLPGANDEIGRLVDTLNEMIERLEHSFTQLEQFSANAAHELRTPLTILKGELQVALDSDLDGDVAKAILESNLEEVDRISRTVENLFMLSRIDNRLVGYEFEAVELRMLLEEIVQGCASLATQRQIKLRLEATASCIVHGDALMLMQLFLNLVENAIKYNHEKGSVTVLLSQSDASVRVKVCDTGIGIPQDQHARIFERFYRVNKQLTRERSGAGLGLSLAQWIANMHGGRIAIVSAPGEGSTFTVTLPIHLPTN